MAGKIQRCYACSPFGVEFQSNKPECPKCGNGPPAVLTLTLVHWLIPMQGGAFGGHGLRLGVACDPQRMTLGATFPASPQPDVVSCPLCQKSPGFADALAVFHEENGGPPRNRSAPVPVAVQVPASPPAAAEVLPAAVVPSTPSTPTDTK